MKTFLSLGDSYTIGEQVLLAESFPYQTVQLLRKKGMEVTAPEIIAKTGWTTDELSAAMARTVFSNRYDLVSLLIGVNNQYRGRTADDFKPEFEGLLKKAIAFAGGRSEKVFVLSVPDWGITPFAAAQDSKNIAAEIDAYNHICAETALKHQVNFIDITGDQRKDHSAEMIAGDGLHPSAKEYAVWAKKLAACIHALAD